ncbi:MAG: penicillin-binding transpeptidase domain-containing protein [Akkermansiaceae bacterium]|nr:penicillin-binding transpeptidase domain-containing protein [Akkermansiaceae bacterium]MDP4846005.1 penicillin-binding transpeptidase domain-containing protein [Akkermansiaceae bacterium]
MEPRFRLRLYLLTALILVGFGTLLSKLHEFQIDRQDEFLALVPGNRTVTVREPGIRGEITDRNGIPLARNLRNYVVSFNLEEILRAYRLQHDESPTLDRLTTQDGLPRKRSEKDIVTIVNEWTIKPLQELGLAKNYNASALRTHYLTHGGLVPFTYRADLTYEDFARLAERNLEFPGVTLSIRPQRQYAYGTLASHVLGYVKQWEKGDISSADKRAYDHYIGDSKGVDGVEATMDEYLRGPEGKKTILKDEKGRTIGMLDFTKPGIGGQVELSIDARIQFLLENTLRRAGRAAGVVMDVRTGEVLAMASVPDYDPNVFIPPFSKPQIEKIDSYWASPRLSPFTNRAIAKFEPGSTMKVATAIAGSIQGLDKNSYNCSGYVPYGNHKIGCWIYNMKGGSHGTLSLPSALQQSCNPYFNQMANAMRWQGMLDGCSLVGFGNKTGIELPNEDPGLLPGSRAWRASYPNETMTPALNAMTSIGQGYMLATPLQLTAMAAAIANGGKYYRPRLVKKVVAEDGKVLVPDFPELVVDLLQNGVKEDDLALIRKGMYMAVNVPGGTAGKVRMDDIEVCAKTGTAQTTDNGKKSNNSWVMAFAPYEEPRYAIVILVQAGTSGGGVCGPLVNTVLTGIFAQENGMRLPLKPQNEYAGHLETIAAIEPLPDILAAIEASEIPASDPSVTAQPSEEDIGETGNEISGIVPDVPSGSTPVLVTPKPTITEETDTEGQVLPRAIPIQE